MKTKFSKDTNISLFALLKCFAWLKNQILIIFCLRFCVKFQNQNFFLSFAGVKFLCSEVIAPIRSEVDDISLFIINFEDLTNPTTPEPIEQVKLSKCRSRWFEWPHFRLFGLNFRKKKTIVSSVPFLSVDRARASFRQSFRIGHIALRDRGLRLAGYLTPPSDATQEEEEIGINRSAIERFESWLDGVGWWFWLFFCKFSGGFAATGSAKRRCSRWRRTSGRRCRRRRWRGPKNWKRWAPTSTRSVDQAKLW